MVSLYKDPKGETVLTITTATNSAQTAGNWGIDPNKDLTADISILRKRVAELEAQLKVGVVF